MNKIDMNNSALGSNVSWVEFTDALGNDDCDDFKFFRRHPVMLKGVEGINYISVLQNIDFFRDNKEHSVTKSLNLICQSDLVGAPLRVFTSSINGELIAINPTTARYAKNWANIIDCFGFEAIFHSTKVSEIGAGYGGECKVFFDIANSTNTVSRTGSYEIYDLISSEKLITRFLKEFGYTVSFNKLRGSKKNKKIFSKHLVISNGALSEMRGELLKTYIYEVVLEADFGYFIVNFDTHSKPFADGISSADFFKLLQENGKNPQWLDESIFLSSFDRGVSKLIIFGGDEELIHRATKMRKKPTLLRKYLYKFIELNSQKPLTANELIKNRFNSVYHRILR